MKKILVGFLVLLQLGVVYGFDQQGFTNYSEANGTISAICKQQCILLGSLIAGNDYVDVGGDAQGVGTLVVGFMVDNQIMPFLQEPISGKKTFSLSGDIASLPNINQIPSNATIVFLVQGNIEIANVYFDAGSKGIFEKFISGVKSASQFVGYTPRTINFMEGPMWNGKYINEAFVLMLIIFLIILSGIYLLSATNKKKIYYVAAILFASMRMFLDMFSTINQQNLYSTSVANKNAIMKNGRLSVGSDFYDFLTYIKENTTRGTKGFFIAPYPYGFEGKYHIYPHISIGTYTGSKVLFYYNPMGEAAKQFGFTDPTIAGTNQMIWNGETVIFTKTLERKPYAKIFFIQ